MKIPSFHRCRFRCGFGALVLALITFPWGVRAESEIIGAYLTWSDDPATTMTINWVNIYPHTPATVNYRVKGENEWQSESGSQHTLTPSVLQVRQVSLSGLQPDTAYEFVIGADPTAAETTVEWFRTMPAELERPVRFVAGGDMMHTREMVDAMNERASILDPDFALLGGDLAYADGLYGTRWIDWLESWTRTARGKGGRLIPMVVAIGNHEVRGHYNGKIPVDAPYFYGLFRLRDNRSYHAHDFGKYLSLIILDSGHTEKIMGPQSDWLAEAMAARDEQTFLFPIYHYPAYGTTKGPPGKLPSEAGQSIQIQNAWIPHFERHGVTAVFENDHHNYKRSHRILRNQRDDERGLLFLGDGAWGVHTRPVPAPGEVWYLAHAEARRHLFHVTLRPDGSAQIDAVDARGEVFDQVSLDRPRTAPVEDSSADQ